MVQPLREKMTVSYQAAMENVAVYKIPSPGYLRISGETRTEYLQRQTTNNLDLLNATRSLPTLLPSPIGRILEVFTLLAEGDALILLTQPGHGPGLAAYFQKNRFFNDQVSIADLSAEWLQYELHGPHTKDFLSQLGFPTNLNLEELVTLDWQGNQLRAIAEEGFGVDFRFRLLAPAAATEQMAALFADLPTMDLETRRSLRVEAGIAGDPEFSSEYTPFEVGLARLVSTEKGCYTGQEVLARQVNYDKIVRSLVRLKAVASMQPGAAVHVEGKKVGEVTSAAVSPLMGAIGLAVLRRPYDENGTKVELHLAGNSIPAKVY